MSQQTTAPGGDPCREGSQRIDVLLGLGRAEQAREQSVLLAAQFPDDPRPHLGMSLALQKLGQAKQAWAPARRALELAPLDVTALQVAAQCAPTSAEAAQLYRRAIELEPDNANLHAMLAIRLAEVNTHDALRSEALVEARRGVELGPDQALSHYALARVARVAGQKALAFQALQQAQALSPDEPLVQQERAVQRAQAHDFEDAAQVIRDGLAQAPNAAELHRARLVFTSRAARNTLVWARVLPLVGMLATMVALFRPGLMVAAAGLEWLVVLLVALANARVLRIAGGDVRALWRAHFTAYPLASRVLAGYLLAAAICLAGATSLTPWWSWGAHLVAIVLLAVTQVGAGLALRRRR